MPTPPSSLPHALPTSLAEMLAIDLDTIDATRSPNADPKLLSAIARPTWLQNKKTSANTPNVPRFTQIPEQIHKYRFDQKRRWITMQKLAIQHPNIEIDDALQLAEWYPDLFWKNPALPSWLLEKPDLLQGASDEVKRAFADCPSTPSEFLAQIVDIFDHDSYHDHPKEILESVARNPKCPPALLLRLADSVHESVRMIAGPRVSALDAAQTATQSAHFAQHRRLGALPNLKDPDDTQQQNADSNVDLSLDGETIHQWAEAAVVERRWYLCLLTIKHPNILPKTLRLFIEMPPNVCAELHIAAEKHPKLPMDCLEALLDAIASPTPQHGQHGLGRIGTHNDTSAVLQNPQLSLAQWRRVFQRQCSFDPNLGYGTILSPNMFSNLMISDVAPINDLAALLRGQPNSLCSHHVHFTTTDLIYARGGLARRKRLPVEVEVAAIALTGSLPGERWLLLREHPVNLNASGEKTELDRLYIQLFQLGSQSNLTEPLSPWLYWCLRKILWVYSPDAAKALKHACSAEQIRWLVTESDFSFDKTAIHCNHLHLLVVEHPNTPTDVLEAIWRWRLKQWQKAINKKTENFYSYFPQRYLQNPRTPAWIIQEIYDYQTARELEESKRWWIYWLRRHPQTPKSILEELPQRNPIWLDPIINIILYVIWIVWVILFSPLFLYAYRKQIKPFFSDLWERIFSPFFISVWWRDSKNFWKLNKTWIIAQAVYAKKSKNQPHG